MSSSSPDCAVIRKFTSQLQPAPQNGPSCCGFVTQAVACSSNGRVTSLTIDGIGSFPTDLATLTELRTLIIKDSLDLTGSMPTSFSSLKNLERLEITNTRMSGPIPSVFDDMTRLRTLNLRANSLNGPVPDSLGKATELRELDLSRNHLTSLPSTLSNLTQLTLLNVFDNHITSPFPLLPKVSADCLTSGPHNKYACLIGPSSLHTGPCYKGELMTHAVCTVTKDGVAVPEPPASNTLTIVLGVLGGVVLVAAAAVGALVYRRQQGARRRKEFMRAIS